MLNNPQNKNVAEKAGDMLTNKFMRIQNTIVSFVDKYDDELNDKLWHDGEFMSAIDEARYRGPHKAARILLGLVIVFMLLFLFWAWISEVDVITRGQGRVIPSSQTQVLQNLEGGIVKEIMCVEGEVVEKGQTLLWIDDVNFSSTYDEQLGLYYSYLARASRLSAEADGKEFVGFPDELLNNEDAEKYIDSENTQFEARRKTNVSQVAILQDQAAQKDQEISELNNKVKQLTEELSFLTEEYKLNEPLVKQGIVPKVEFIRLKRQIATTEGELKSAELAMPRAETALKEAKQRIEEKTFQFKSDALKELGVIKTELDTVEKRIRVSKDRVARTEITSPLRGTVKQIHIQAGGVIQSGMNLVEIVPIDDTLLVEAQIRPADVAFLHPGQGAKVKITAYDFSIYGGLLGKVERISADTITDEVTQENFYKVIVRTDKNYLLRGGEKLLIKPGMVAGVDILTGQRTILDYMLKPILRAKQQSFTER
ncbi:MAG: HlyD family type I secretion periplasmic adaptor subunit [Alphaproteobacteria bacterium]|nr:HlyD family type I secretion periplasmic adaptor subunit [Alphaproteobacteria bacterium]